MPVFGFFIVKGYFEVDMIDKIDSCISQIATGTCGFCNSVIISVQLSLLSQVFSFIFIAHVSQSCTNSSWFFLAEPPVICRFNWLIGLADLLLSEDLDFNILIF